MRKSLIIKLLILCGVALLVVSCKPNCDINKPKGVKPIDWENYNDVYTVFWNGVRDCSSGNFDDAGKDIKVFGWIFQGPIYPDGKPLPVNPEKFALISNEEDIFWWNFSTRGGQGIYVNAYRLEDVENYRKLVDKFATADITKKCYISGKLYFQSLPNNDCCSTISGIQIYSADDIYFE